MSAQPLKSCVARGKLLPSPFISIHLTAGKIPVYLPGLLGKWDTVLKCLEYEAGTYRPSVYLSSQLIVLWKSESEVAQSCWTLWDPMDCSLPGSSVCGIFQARILEWVAISFSRRSSQPRDPALKADVLPLSHQGSPYTAEPPGKPLANISHIIFPSINSW